MVADGCGEASVRDGMVEIVEKARSVGGVLDCIETCAPIGRRKGGGGQGNDNHEDDEGSQADGVHINQESGVDRES